MHSNFKEKLTNLSNYPKFGCPFKRGNSFYYFHNSGLQPQSVLYKQDALDSPATVFFDPNTLSEDGTISLSTYSFSESGKYFAYALSQSGSDWVKIHVKSTELGTSDLEEPLEWVKFSSIEWTHDDKGFFYKQYPRPKVGSDKAGTETDANKQSTVYYHLLGTPQSSDIKIFTDPVPDNLPYCEVTDDGKYLILAIQPSCEPKNKLYIMNLDEYLANPKPFPEFAKIIDVFENSYDYITNDGPLFWFMTTLDAPKKRVVKYDLTAPEKGFVEVIPETGDVISFISAVDNDKLVIARLQDVKHVTSVYSLYTGEKLYDLPLPQGSMIGSMTGKRKQGFMFYSFSSFISPGITYRFDFDTAKHTVFRETQVKG